MTGLDTAIQRTLDLGTPSTLGETATTGHPRTGIGLVVCCGGAYAPKTQNNLDVVHDPPDGITVGITSRHAR